MDIVRYRCGFAADSQLRKELKEAGVPKEEHAELLASTDYERYALHNVKQFMLDIADRFDGESMRSFLSGDGNFRETVATLLPYKGNRPGTKPKYYESIGEYSINVWGTEVVEGQEADDAIGIAQWERPDGSTIIVSIDKDLDMIPGHHYNTMHDRYYFVEENDANLHFFRQMLWGDTTDNIPGIKDIGEKRSLDLINENGRDVNRVREAVKRLYQKQYGDTWEAAYREVGTLLWIRREPEQECPLL